MSQISDTLDFVRRQDALLGEMQTCLNSARTSLLHAREAELEVEHERRAPLNRDRRAKIAKALENARKLKENAKAALLRYEGANRRQAEALAEYAGEMIPA